MRNVLGVLKGLLASPSLQVGEVIAVSAVDVTVQLAGSGVVSARGTAQLGDKVYVRDGVIEGPAPNLPTTNIEV